jgi:hypothetical protein
MGGIGEDLQEVLRRGFAGLHPRHDAAHNQVGWVQSRTVVVGKGGSSIVDTEWRGQSVIKLLHGTG